MSFLRKMCIDSTLVNSINRIILMLQKTTNKKMVKILLHSRRIQQKGISTAL